MIGIGGADACESFGDRRRMMCEVVVHRDSAGSAAKLHASSHAFGTAECLGHGVRAEADRGAHCYRGERILTLNAPSNGISKVPAG